MQHLTLTKVGTIYSLKTCLPILSDILKCLRIWFSIQSKSHLKFLFLYAIYVTNTWKKMRGWEIKDLKELVGIYLLSKVVLKIVDNQKMNTIRHCCIKDELVASKKKHDTSYSQFYRSTTKIIPFYPYINDFYVNLIFYASVSNGRIIWIQSLRNTCRRCWWPWGKNADTNRN